MRRSQIKIASKATLLAMSFSAALSLSFSAAAQNRPSAPAREFRFEVLSIRPLASGLPSKQSFAPTSTGFVSGMSIGQMLLLAYAPGDFLTWRYTEIRNLPNWSGDFYDINARVASADFKAWQSQSKQQELLHAAMRAALKERCKLVIHDQPSVGDAFELIVTKSGPRLTAAKPGATLPTGAKLPSGGVVVGTRVNGKEVEHWHGATMEDLAWFLARLGVPVRDRTGLTGRYDFMLREIDQPEGGQDGAYSYPVDHLGLKLKPGKESRPIWIIAHMEKPVAN